MSFFLYFPNDWGHGIGVLQRLPQRYETYPIWVTRDLESHQTARHFLGKSPAERELLRVQLTTSRSDFSGELALEKKILRHSLSFAIFLTATQSHICSLHLLYPLVVFFIYIDCLHSFYLLLLCPLSAIHPSLLPPSFSPLVSITVKLYSVVGGNTISFPIAKQD